MKTNIQRQAFGTAVFLVLASVPAWADGDIGNLPATLMNNLGIIANIMQTIAIMMGLALFIGGVFQLKRYGEMRTMMSSQMSMAGPLMMLISGIAMLCAPLMMGTVLVSFWGPGGASDLPYDGDTGSGWAQYIEPVLMLIRLVGVYAFMRAFVMAAKTGSGHAQPGTTGKVLTQLFAGILCVHIMGTIQLMESIFGFSFSI